MHETHSSKAGKIHIKISRETDAISGKVLTFVYISMN